MAAIRYLSHSSLILLIAVINGCVSEYSQLTIQVSESGHDKLSCLQEPQHACKTLLYVLNQMNNSTFNSFVVSEVLINVTYNQTIHQKLFEVNYMIKPCYPQITICKCRKKQSSVNDEPPPENQAPTIEVSVTTVSLHDYIADDLYADRVLNPDEYKKQ